MVTFPTRTAKATNLALGVVHITHKVQLCIDHSGLFIVVANLLSRDPLCLLLTADMVVMPFRAAKLLRAGSDNSYQPWEGIKPRCSPNGATEDAASDSHRVASFLFFHNYQKLWRCWN